jgi:hypothetical protein
MNEITKRYDPESHDTEKEMIHIPTTQDFVKKLRKLNEELEGEEHVNLKTDEDQSREEEKMNRELERFKVMTEYAPLEVYDDYVFWGGIVDGYIRFTYRVPAKPGEEGVKFTYSEEGFSVDNPEKEEIVETIEVYYDQFFDYWSEGKDWSKNVFNTAEEQGTDNA